MKYILLLVVVIAGCSSTKDLPPAEPSTNMMDQADRVILIIDSDPETTYKQIGQFLTDQGFALDQTDAELLTVQTGYQTFGGVLSEYMLRITASVRDSTINFTGQTGNPLFGEVEAMNGKRGKYGNSVRKAWEKMVEIATEFPHQQVYYSRN